MSRRVQLDRYGPAHVLHVVDGSQRGERLPHQPGLRPWARAPRGPAREAGSRQVSPTERTRNRPRASPAREGGCVLGRPLGEGERGPAFWIITRLFGTAVTSACSCV